MLSAYLASNFDEQRKYDDNEQVVKDANSSDDDVDDLECEITDGGHGWWSDTASCCHLLTRMS